MIIAFARGTVGRRRVAQDVAGPRITTLSRLVSAGPLDVPTAEAAEEEARLLEEIAKITPSHERLLELAQKSPPPPEWFAWDDDNPFEP